VDARDRAQNRKEIEKKFHRLLENDNWSIIRDKHGPFTKKDLEVHILSRYTPDEQQTLLEMMESRGICFKVRGLPNGEWEYLAPEFLPEWSDVRELLLGRVRNDPPNAEITARYPFLREDLLRDYLLKLGNHAPNAPIYWGASILSYFHFCSARDCPSLDPDIFIQSLSQRLSSLIPGHSKAIWRCHNPILASQGAENSDQEVVIEHITFTGRPSTWFDFDLMVRKPLEESIRSDFVGRILVVVDVLNESWMYDPGNNIPILLARAVIHSQNMPPQFRLLLTSRPDPRVLRYIGPQTLDLIVDVPPDEDEIQDYAERRLQAVGLPGSSLLASTVSAMSKGNFLFAQFLVRHIESQSPQIEALELKVPSGLDDVYRDFMRRDLVRDEQYWRERHEPLLRILAVAYGDGLTLSQLTGITGLPQSETNVALRKCAQYLRGHGAQGPFRIYHWSFEKFLCTDEHFGIPTRQAHSLIASFFLRDYRGEWHRCEDSYCLQYLPQHLLAIIRDGEIKTPDEETGRALVSLLTDAEFAHARGKCVKQSTIRDELNTALDLVPRSSFASTSLFTQLRRMSHKEDAINS
jgi:hypothetical protein